MKRNFEFLEKALLATFLFLLPTQLGYHFWYQWSYVFGIRVDYLSPTIYLTDILSIILILVLFLDKKLNFSKFNISILIIIFLFSIANIINSTNYFITIFRWVKLLELLLLSYYFSKQTIFSQSTLLKILLFSSAAFSLIGVAQFLLHRTIGGLFYLLGERSFNQSTPGIALFNFANKEHLRAYSTFSHPNSLAGYMSVVLLFSIFSFYKSTNILEKIEILLIVICLLLTNSYSSFISLFFVISIYLLDHIFGWIKINKVIIVLLILVSLVLPLVSQNIVRSGYNFGENIQQRLELSYVSGKMISGNFWLGTGAGTFVTNVTKYKSATKYLWYLQPVHNIFLLVFSDTGIFGIVLFYLLIMFAVGKSQHNISKRIIYYILLFVVTSGLFDHYWLTLQQNILLLSVFMGTLFNDKIA
ncbi:MAG: hypothetical protein GYA62_08560 [Bacteroidales bacterium]|nr:hypothetical protein [Bacteroidales bacterium]